MKVKWLGHASFLITSEKGTRIILDPYKPDDRLHYGEIKESADIVTKSHEHGDHSNIGAVRGNPRVYSGPDPEEIKGIKLRSVFAFHDNKQGQEKGKVMILCLDVDGVNLCHVGDLGHKLSDSDVAKIGKVDILMIPVGGFYTIDHVVATEVAEQLKAKVIIPMHFKNGKNNFPIVGVEDFIKDKKNVARSALSEMEFKPGTLPAKPQIIVLTPAL